jgi:hypothetical protein
VVVQAVVVVPVGLADTLPGYNQRLCQAR